MIDGEKYDVIVIGGGPAALAESLRLKECFRRVLVISDDFGGCCSIMGNMRLQSYAPELSIDKAPLELAKFMQNVLDSRPTGGEYASYVSECFGSSAIETRRGRVESLDRDRGGFLVAGQQSNRQFVLRAERVVLATGLQSKEPTIRLCNGADIHCFDAYRKLTNREIAFFNARAICVVGGGNSAYQLAYAMARFASSVTILAKRYDGFYPMDCQDHFALRAPSLPAIELVKKTSETISQTGPINNSSGSAPVFLHIYDTLWEDLQTNQLCARLLSSKNGTSLLSASLKAACARGFISPSEDGSSLWHYNVSGLILVHAIGVRANTPKMPWPDLLDAKTGFIRHQGGKTAIAGLYVAGGAAGYPSVNRMQPLTDVT